MKKFFSFLVAMIFCFCCLVGCWDGDGGDGGGGSKSEPAANEEDGTGTVIFTLAFPDSNFVADANFVDPNATGDVVLQWREFDPRNLPEYRELPEPSADEPSAVIGVDNARTREKSSNEFYDFLRNDLKGEKGIGEVRLDFYGPNYLSDIYGDYLGSRTVNAYDFFAGTAQEKVKAREYYIHAMTYCEFSGYCFQADAHVIFLPNESNRVLFSFRPTGNVLIPCYIPNPAGKYWGNRYDQYHATLKANSAYVWNGPCYNERGELEFTISYAYGNLADIRDEEMELSVTGTDGELHIMKFTFNLLDILTRQRPLQLVAEEVPTGTIQYSGEFEDEKREITVDSPADGDVINGFPLIIRGITIGIPKVALQVKNITRGTTPYENFVDIPKDGGFYFSVETFEGVNTGDELKIIITDWRYFQEIPTPENVEIVSVDVVVGATDPITLHKDTSFPDGTANAPTEVGVEGVKGLINLGSFIAQVNTPFRAIDFMAITKIPVKLGQYVDTLMLILRNDESQVGHTVMYPPDDGITPVMHSFRQSIDLLVGGYKFQLYATVKTGFEIPAEFKFQLSIAGTATGEHFQTPFVEGQNICIVPAGYGAVSVTFTGDQLPRVMCGDTAVAANFQIAETENYVLEEATFEVPPSGSQAIRSVYLFNEATCLNEFNCFITGDTTTVAGMSFTIPANTEKVVRVEYHLMEVGIGGAPSGLNLKTTFKRVVLRDATTGNRKVVEVNATGNDIYVYKSFPALTQVPLTNEELKIVNGNSQAIYKWKVEASSCGNIGIKQMPRLKVEWQDLGAAQSELRLSSLRLFRGTTDLTDFVEITNQDGVSVKMSALTEADNSIFIYFSPEEIIAGGATLFYTLKATPENFDSAPSGSDKVALIMLADKAPSGNKRYVYCDNGIWKLAEDISGTNAEQFNSLWSDRSEVPHSAISGMSTTDWFNGYLIKNLPLSPVIMAPMIP